VLPLVINITAPEPTGIYAHHIIAPELIYSVPYISAELIKTNKFFGETIDLWRASTNSGIPNARYALQSELDNKSATYNWATNDNEDGNSHPSRLTVENKAVNYSLFTSGDFSAALNLTPLYLRPQDNIPTQVIPGLSGSFHF
jgi:hypothetical protein